MAPSTNRNVDPISSVMALPSDLPTTGQTGKDAPVTAARSRLMARVRGRDTKPEMVCGDRSTPSAIAFVCIAAICRGTPDIVLPRYRTVAFVHGCFWHRHEGCGRTTVPKTRAAFWQDKFAANVARDRRTREALERAGWRCETVWECETKDEARLRDRLISLFASGR